MSPNRKTSWLVAGVLTLLAGLPTLADDEFPLQDGQLFAPTELRPYGDAPRPPEGYFASFEGMFMLIGRPHTAMIGQTGTNLVSFTNTAPAWAVIGTAPNQQAILQFPAGVAFQNSTATTGDLTDKEVLGNRFEFGHMGPQNGWLCDVTVLQSQDQHLAMSNVGIVFNDPLNLLVIPVQTIPPTPQVITVNGDSRPFPVPVTDVPVIFKWFFVDNHVDTWSTEVNYVRRFQPFHRGGHFELLLGAKYMEFNEQFNVRGEGSVLDAVQFSTSTATPSHFGNSFWNTEVDNHIIGPQLGGRWHKDVGPWGVSAEGRFMAGYNRQNFQQLVRLVDAAASIGLPAGGPPTLRATFASNGVAYAAVDQFSPVLELRGDLRYQFTKNISAKVGWTAIWMDGIARASSAVDYTLPTMGLITNRNVQDVFITGATVGVEVNR